MSILKIGLPTAIGGSTMQFGFLLMSRNVNVYGATAMTHMVLETRLTVS